MTISIFNIILVKIFDFSKHENCILLWAEGVFLSMYLFTSSLCYLLLIRRPVQLIPVFWCSKTKILQKEVVDMICDGVN
jgi:hypothetical protein